MVSNQSFLLVRRLAIVGTLSVLLGLTGCGGGDIGPAVTFDIGLMIGGVAVSGVQIAPGQTQSISVNAGQSIELDASEPVQWTLDVGGSAVTGSGTTVYYGGVAITQTTVSNSRILIDTAADAPLAAPLQVTLVATSTIDATQVATINVWIN
ncbi:MAG: hypothetical protein JOY60_00875 [Burkholderiaceae bacterium]|nr:hypothetical protein [Burkholderiaceae bacterium]